MHTATHNPLKGARGLVFSNVPSSRCRYPLATFGADGVKVETPGRAELARQLGANPDRSEALRGGSIRVQSPGKRSIRPRLVSPDALAVLHAFGYGETDTTTLIESEAV